MPIPYPFLVLVGIGGAAAGAAVLTSLEKIIRDHHEPRFFQQIGAEPVPHNPNRATFGTAEHRLFIDVIDRTDDGTLCRVRRPPEDEKTPLDVRLRPGRELDSRLDNWEADVRHGDAALRTDGHTAAKLLFPTSLEALEDSCQQNAVVLRSFEVSESGIVAIVWLDSRYRRSARANEFRTILKALWRLRRVELEPPRLWYDIFVQAPPGSMGALEAIARLASHPDSIEWQATAEFALKNGHPAELIELYERGVVDIWHRVDFAQMLPHYGALSPERAQRVVSQLSDSGVRFSAFDASCSWQLLRALIPALLSDYDYRDFALRRLRADLDELRPGELADFGTLIAGSGCPTAPLLDVFASLSMPPPRERSSLGRWRVRTQELARMVAMLPTGAILEPSVEKALIGALEVRDTITITPATQALGRAGTALSLYPLERCLKDNGLVDVKGAKLAIKQIEARQQDLPDAGAVSIASSETEGEMSLTDDEPPEG